MCLPLDQIDELVGVTNNALKKIRKKGGAGFENVKLSKKVCVRVIGSCLVCLYFCRQEQPQPATITPD